MRFNLLPDLGLAGLLKAFASGPVFRPGGLSRRHLQTNVTSAASEPRVPSRQVRRQAERLARKGRKA